MTDALLRNPNESFLIIATALSDAGYVVKITGAGAGDVCGAGDKAFGITRQSSKNPITGVAAANAKLGLQDVGESYVQVLATNVAIAVGDVLFTTAGGTVDKGTIGAYTDLKKIVGTALEAVGANSGGGVRMKVKLHFGREC